LEQETYAVVMDLLPCLKPGTLIVSLIPHTRHTPIIPELIAELALRGPVTVMDGGNCFPAYHIAQLIRRKNLQVEAISRHIFVQRAFTCYQMVSLLENIAAFGYPHIILNLLSTFQDDQIKPDEADRLLTLCLSHIERLRLSAPVVVTLEPVILAEKEFLVQRICEQANEIFTLHSETDPQEKQLSLFQGL
jgi:hypothetical protein